MLEDLTSRLLVLVTLAFIAWVTLLIALRRAPGPVAGLLAALLSWALASAFVPWLVDALQRYHAWPLV